MTVTDKAQQLSEYWELLFPGAAAPSTRDWALWLLEHDEKFIRQAMRMMATRYKPTKRPDHIEHLPKIVGGIVVRLEKEAATKTAATPVTAGDENRGNR
jgi:hypothetical protein